MQVLTRNYSKADVRWVHHNISAEVDTGATWGCRDLGNDGFRFTLESSLLSTRGGYRWRNVQAYGNFNDECGVNNTDAWALDAVLVSARDPAGHMLNHPPIHLHHFGLINTPFRVWRQPEVYLQTGELTCADVEHPYTTTECLIVRYRHPKRLLPKFYLNADYNDVRTANSTALSWRPHLTLWMRPVTRMGTLPKLWTGKRQVYMRFPKSEVELTGLDTIPVPTDRETFSTYSFRMNATGVISPELTFHHVHNAFSRKAYLFKASPEQIGMATYDTCLPYETAKSRFLTNANMEAQLEASPHLVCVMHSNNTFDSAGRNYDKRPYLHCKARAFGPDDIFTSVDSWGHHPRIKVGATFHEHNGWDVHYTTTEPIYFIAWGGNSLPLGEEDMVANYLGSNLRGPANDGCLPGCTRPDCW